MARPTKISHALEEEDVERDIAPASREAELDPDERTVSMSKDDDEYDVEEEDITDEIDLDALPAMEGPDA